MTSMSTHSTRQPMPVLNALLQPGSRVHLPPDHRGGPSRLARGDHFARHLIDIDQARRVWVGMIPDVRDLLPEQLIRKARRHRTQDQARADKSLGVQVVESLGPQRMPFPHLWIEFAIEDTDGVHPLAAYAVETDYGYGICYFRLMPTGEVATPNLVEQIETGPDGAITTIHAKWAIEGMEDDPVADEDEISLMHVSLPVMWAIGLMNCRNVATVEVVPRNRSSKKQLRKRKPGVSYHTIVLPSVRHSGGRSGAAGGDPAGLALHKVRGHFKTYTADAPLLGRHVGTYWWGHQVRGSKDHGEVVSDYQMTS